MFIQSIRIKNLRAYSDETVDFAPYTCMVGANGAGKSTILCALNIFFRETENSATNLSNLDKEDFHGGDTEAPIEITITFNGLSADAQQDFVGYYRQNALIVTAKAIFDPSAGSASVKQFGNRMGFEDFMPFFKLLGDGGKVADLQAVFVELRVKYPDIVNAKTKDAMIAALRDYETERPDQCILIPSEDQFYGVSQGQGLLRKYLQWVYVPAVKDAAGEQAEGKNTALGRLLARTVRAKVNFSEKLADLRSEAEEKYRAMLATEQSALDDISGDLQKRLAEWSHPDATAKLNWHQDPKSSVRIEEPMARLLAGDAEFEGSIARFGHGLQRSYIIALLQGLAADGDQDAPKLLLGVEEPELYQHPPQARHLAAVLQALSEHNAQVIVSTHSPYFVDGAGFDRVRLVRKVKDQKHSVVRTCPIQHLGAEYARVTGEQPTPVDGVMAKLHQVMQPHLSEMFFSPKLVLVEGLEDAAYINAWMVLSGRWESLRASGAHIVAVNGKSELIRPTIIAAKMEIPAFVVFDCDGDKLTHADPARAQSITQAHERDNKALFGLVGGNTEEPFPTVIRRGDRYSAWPADLGKCVEAEAGASWNSAGNVASVSLGGVSGLKKNTLHIGARLKELHRLGVAMPTLTQLCDDIIAFAEPA
jgi:putative ATP-dependent endonuclease of OLD family